MTKGLGIDRPANVPSRRYHGGAVAGLSSICDLLRAVRGVLAVVAHPDDESFGLGAVLDRLTTAGAASAVLCFTHGEASTLHGPAGDLAVIRADELAEAADVLGIGRVELMDYPDGGLSDVPLTELSGHVERLAAEVGPSHLLVFDLGGVTGHPDHQRATEAALAAADRLELAALAWALPQAVADRLNAELGTSFVGRGSAEIDHVLTVTRARQQRAIDCHRSQSTDNTVLRRRLELLGSVEHLRLLRPPQRAAPRRTAPDNGAA